VAIQNHLDPDTTLPEDLMLLACDEKGELATKRELGIAQRALELERHERLAALKGKPHG